MVRSTGPGTAMVGPFRELTETEKREASLVLAGIAIEKCTCTAKQRKKPHTETCLATCGLREVLDALSLMETDDDDLQGEG